MTNAQALEKLSLKELGALAVSYGFKGWTHLRKGGLIEYLSERLPPLECESQSKRAPSSASSPSTESADDSPSKSRRGRRAGRKSVQLSDRSAPNLFDVMLKKSKHESDKSKAEDGVKTKSKAKVSKKVVEETSDDTTEKVVKSEARQVAEQDSEKPTRKRRKRVSLEVVVSEPVVSLAETSVAEEKVAVEEGVAEPKAEEKVTAATTATELEIAPKKRGRKKRQTLVEASATETTALTSVLETIDKTSEAEVPGDVKSEQSPTEEPPRKKRAYRRRKGLAEPSTIEEASSSVPNSASSSTSSSVETPKEPVQADVELTQDAEPAVKPKRAHTRRRTKKSQGVAQNETLIEEPTETRSSEKTSFDETEQDKAEQSKQDENEQDENETFVRKSDGDSVFEVESEERVELPPKPVEQLPPPPEEVLSLKEKLRLQKVIGSPHDQNDRLVLMVCDSYWLRACWEITSQLVDRVRSAMGRYWHTADPILRVYRVDKAPQTASIRREHYADLEIRGGVDNWYVPVDDPPSCFMVELGYKSRDQQFFTLISSNIVETPQRCLHDEFGRSVFGGFSPDSTLDSFSRAGQRGNVSRSFTEQEEDYSAPRSKSRFGQDSDSNGFFWQTNPFRLEVDAEVVVKGKATPGSTVRVKDEPLRLSGDGSFSIRFSLPERRHVFPVVAQSPDGVETQTIVLAVDRNTKTLDPVYKEDEEE